MRCAVVAGRGRDRMASVLAARAGLPVTDELASWDRLLVVGDDADLAAVAGSLGGRPGPALAVTGARSLGALFAHDDDALGRLVAGAEYPCDLIWLAVAGTDHPVVGTVRAGAGATVERAFPWWGPAGSVTIATGARTVVVESARAVTVANAQVSGPWTVAPRAAVMDGRCDIHAFAGARRRLVRLRPALRAGVHERSPQVRRTTANAATILVPPTWPVSADGRRIGAGPFAVTVARAAFRLLV